MQSTLDDESYGAYADEYQDHYGFGSDEGVGVDDNFDSKEPARPEVNFEDPAIASLPRILLMGPRRSGKTSIQVRTFVV